MPNNPESYNESHGEENELLEKRNAMLDAVEEAKQRIREDFAVRPEYFAKLVEDAYLSSGQEPLSKEQFETLLGIIEAAGSDQQTISGAEVADAIFGEQ